MMINEQETLRIALRGNPAIVRTVSRFTPAELERAVCEFQGKFVFLDDAEHPAPASSVKNLQAELENHPEAAMAVGIPGISKTEQMQMPGAVLTETIPPYLAGKLIRTDAFKKALEQTKELELDLLMEYAILAAIQGSVLLVPVKKAAVIPRRDVKPANYAEFPRFADFAAALPHEGPEEDFQMQLDSVTYRMLAAELENQPDRECLRKLPVMLETLDERLVYFAFTWYKKNLLNSLKVERREQPPRPVKNIGIFCGTLRSGGAERCASLLMQLFVSGNKNVTLFSKEARTKNDYACPESVQRVVLPIVPHERRARLAVELKERQIDTCIFFDTADWRTGNDILSARHAGTRIIAMEHSLFAYPWYMGMPEIAIQRACVYPAADVVTVLSRADQNLWRTYGITRAVFVPNPLTFDLSRPIPEHENNRTMIFVARLSPEKGADDALDVLSIVRKTCKDAKLIMVGRGMSAEFDAALRQKADDLQMTDAVIFTGYTPDVAQYYQQASVLLMPSGMEGYPMTLMEAKAYAIPTVLYDMPYLEATKSGCISVPQGDIDAMADAVCDLFQDPEKMQRLSRQAKDSLQEFSMEKVSAEWDQIFRFLETGSDPDGLFAEKEPPETRLELLKIAMDQCHKASSVCMEHPVFLEKTGMRILESYLKKHSFLHVIDRIGKMKPRLAGFFDRLGAGICKSAKLKNLYRNHTVQEERGGKNGFPPYC